MRPVRAVTTTTIVLLAVIQAAMSVISPEPKVFFSDIKDNLTKIVWAHAVNSKAKLDKALNAGDVMMLEADVVLGKVNATGNTNSSEIPIMAHPPARESDLSLEDFIAEVVQDGKKGIKLDFKTIEAFDQSKPILTRWRNNLTIPVIINADILSGPVNATDTPVDAKAFLTGAAAIFPESTLSVGWTTRYGTEFNITEGRYTTEQLQKMINTLKEQNVTQAVTYPVRAGLAVNNIEGIKSLLKNSSTPKSATLTIWSSNGDSVDTVKLSNLIKDVGVKNVYVDVPMDVWKKLDVSAASTVGTMMTFVSILFALVLSRML